jgi:hypothetical protein
MTAWHFVGKPTQYEGNVRLASMMMQGYQAALLDDPATKLLPNNGFLTLPKIK